MWLPTLLICVLTASSESVPSKIACTKLHKYPFKWFSSDCYTNPNVMSLTPEMISNNGYEFDTYEVTTPDGYILTLYRIPPGKDDNRKKKQPVFMLHGIATDSSLWVDVGDRSLAFNLADMGYDVWLGNSRGTRYSNKHVTLQFSDSEYWNYTWDDLAAYDLKTSLRKVADETGMTRSIIHIGHSKGSALMLLFASEFPNEAHELLRGVIALCPVGYFDYVWYMKPLVRPICTLTKFLKLLHVPALFSNIELTTRVLQILCTFLPHVCRFSINFVCGETTQFLPQDLLTLFSNFPISIALNEILQVCQFSLSDSLEKFDFGKNGNLEMYGQEKPPLYDLSKANISISLIYGKRDSFIGEKSVGKMLRELGSTEKSMFSVPINITDDKLQFDHIDFLFSEFLKTLFYKDLFVALEKWALD